jgi:hypothetical protein
LYFHPVDDSLKMLGFMMEALYRGNQEKCSTTAK